MLGTNHIFKIIFFLFLLIAFNIEAKNNHDPSWQTMLDSSDLIAKVKFTTSGDFEAKANLTTVYKGNCDEKDLLITGFSKKGVKINHVSAESEYILFLKKNKDNYTVWTPTAGFLKVEKKHVQYDLLQTTIYFTQEFYTLKLFEKFLIAAVNKDQDNSGFHTSQLELLKKKILYPICAQYVMMLKLSGYKEYNSMFLDIMYNEDPNARIALARYLGSVHTEKARENLVSLLNDKNEIVAEEAANELIFYEPSLAGDALLRKFKETGNKNDLRSENGSISQFKIKLMKSLLQINYTPAVEYFIPMLQTKNKYLFNLTLDAITKLNGENYIAYFEKHILDNNEVLFNDIFNHICDKNLVGGDNLIMKFLESLDKQKQTGYHYLVSSKGLGVFSDTTVSRFVLKEFGEAIEKKKLPTPKLQKLWIESYYDFFINKSNHIYADSIYSFTGKLIGFDFNKINSDTIYSDSFTITIESSYPFDLFLNYLSKNGNINDLIFLHKIESVINLNNETRLSIENIIASLEKRLIIFESSDD